MVMNGRTGLRLLILEDDARDAELEAHALRRADPTCVIQVVATRGAFLETLESFLPDVLLSDSGVPGLRSIEALQLLQDHLSSTPLILVCGALDLGSIRCLKAGAADFVFKGDL